MRLGLLGSWVLLLPRVVGDTTVSEASATARVTGFTGTTAAVPLVFLPPWGPVYPPSMYRCMVLCGVLMCCWGTPVGWWVPYSLQIKGRNKRFLMLPCTDVTPPKFLNSSCRYFAHNIKMSQIAYHLLRSSSSQRLVLWLCVPPPRTSFFHSRRWKSTLSVPPAHQSVATWTNDQTRPWPTGITCLQILGRQACCKLPLPKHSD